MKARGRGKRPVWPGYIAYEKTKLVLPMSSMQAQAASSLKLMIRAEIIKLNRAVVQ